MPNSRLTNAAASQAIHRLVKNGQVGRVTKRVLTFDGDLSGKATVSEGGPMMLVRIGDYIDPRSLSAVYVCVRGLDYPTNLVGKFLSLDEEGAFVVSNTYRDPLGIDIESFYFLETGIPVVLGFPESIEDEDLAIEQGTYVYYGPTSQGDGTDNLYIKRIEFEAVKTIDRKTLPGVYMPLVEIEVDANGFVSYPGWSKLQELRGGMCVLSIQTADPGHDWPHLLVPSVYYDADQVTYTGVCGPQIIRVRVTDQNASVTFTTI